MSKKMKNVDKNIDDEEEEELFEQALKNEEQKKCGSWIPKEIKE